MKNRLFFFRPAIFLFIFLYSVPSYATSRDTLSGSSLHPYGRYSFDKKTGVELISSAVHFGFQFTGTSCSVYAYINDRRGHNYLQYTLDGNYQRRIRISGSSRQPAVIGGLSGGRHTIWIYKATEATTGPIFIEKITGHDIRPLKEPDHALIEFIGNSITCGAAADPSEIPCGMGEYHDQHNAYYAYGPRVARTLNVNFILSSVSGIGIYRSWNTPSPSMPQVYAKTDFLANSNRNWDFNTYHPKIVSIALGTNDFSDGDHSHPRPPFDSSVFVSGYIDFVQQVKSKYPRARIVLLSSPMLNGNKRLLLQNCLTTVKKNIDKNYPRDKAIALYFFQPMKARGCGGHPNLEDHAILAEELTPFFRKLLVSK